MTTATGEAVTADWAVLANVMAPTLFLELVGAEHLPPRFVDDVGRFQFDHGL
ncbi:MAG TPA: hypothetical protein VGV93_04050 [Acidimicrobiales bacterium]|nr:hypothetical protein [Acidimicrobiales bacterium]